MFSFRTSKMLSGFFPFVLGAGKWTRTTQGGKRRFPGSVTQYGVLAEPEAGGSMHVPLLSRIWAQEGGVTS